MRNRRCRCGAQCRSHPHGGAAAPRIPRLRLGRARGADARAPARPRARGGQSQGSRGRPRRGADRRVTSASPTPAGPPTACRPRAMRIRTSRATASPSCTTASSRITRRCAPGSSTSGTPSARRPTPKSIAHRIHHHLASSAGLYEAVRSTVARIARARTRWRSFRESDPDCIVLAREGCPVVIGLGIDENFVASDVAALLPVTRRFMFLEEGDVAEIRRKSIRIVDSRRRIGRSRRCARASWPPTPSSAASTGISCSRRFTSSRAPSRRRWRSA